MSRPRRADVATSITNRSRNRRQNGVAAETQTTKTVEAIADELANRQAGETFGPLDGAHDLVFTTTKASSSGKLGPFVGAVTQTFLDDAAFENAVALGPLRVALRATRTKKDERTRRAARSVSEGRLHISTLRPRRASRGSFISRRA